MFCHVRGYCLARRTVMRWTFLCLIYRLHVPGSVHSLKLFLCHFRMDQRYQQLNELTIQMNLIKVQISRLVSFSKHKCRTIEVLVLKQPISFPFLCHKSATTRQIDLYHNLGQDTWDKSESCTTFVFDYVLPTPLASMLLESNAIRPSHH